MRIDLNLDELEQAAKAATPGPWRRQAFHSDGSRNGIDDSDGGVVCASYGHKRDKDFDFIAAANPRVVLELVCRLREAEKAVKSLDTALTRQANAADEIARDTLDAFDKLDALVQAKEASLNNPEQSGAPFGIIDPDYARIYTQARIIAWTYGYSCSAQGSFTRDLDLLLVPWTDTAKQNIDQIVTHLASVCDLRINGVPSDKPHGRRAWTLMLPGFGECRWVDLSAFAPAQEAKSGE